MRAFTRPMSVAILVSSLTVAQLGAEPANEDSPKRNSVDQQAALLRFNAAHPGVGLSERAGRVTQVYGKPISHGLTPADSAQAFITQQAAIFGARASELEARSNLPDGRHEQPIMFDRTTGRYKFTIVYYTQTFGGVPVYNADLRLLVRNEPSFPLVLVQNGLRDLGEFTSPPAHLRDPARGHTNALLTYPGLLNFTDAEAVIWAGVDDMVVAPRAAYEFTGDNGRLDSSSPQKRLFVVDALTGDILHEEDKVLDADIDGNVSALATEGPAADFCGDEILTAMPYAVVVANGVETFADEFGDFVLPDDGADPVAVQSPVRGRYFRVENMAGVNSNLSADVSPPGSIEFLHNQDNNNQDVLAEINGYIHANVVRDFVLQYSSDYPEIGTQEDFTVNVNRIGGICPCNAQYTGDAINFCRQSGTCPNMAFSVIIHHEYGHHLIALAGSGQGAYGEGMSDVMGVLITDQPEGGIGFSGNCTDSSRSADNDLQFPCAGAIHICGQLLSGAVWETRNELLLTEPDDYRDTIGSIAVNAILLHTGSGITPDITVHYLTLDDDDDTLDNGSPHYTEIATGFGEHNLNAPPLAPLAFVYPQGRPVFSDPNVGAGVVVEIQSIAETLDTDNGPVLLASIDGKPFSAQAMTLDAEENYVAQLPAAPCFSSIDWYVAAETLNGTSLTSPANAPSNTFGVVVASDTNNILAEDFENENGGYVVGGDVQNTDTGRWERGVPVGGGDRGDPPIDFDGSGNCWLTGNEDGNTDVDDGETTLTTPAFDMSAPGVLHLVSYARWYSNTNGASPNADVFVVDVSNDDGNSWVNLETVGPAGVEADGGWFHVTHTVNDFVEPTSVVRLRFNASDFGAGSVIEAGIDALSIDTLECEDEDVTPPTIMHDDGQLTKPFSGYIDPRMESNNGVDLDLGLTELSILFSEPVFSRSGGDVSPSDFDVVVTGGIVPKIASVSISENPLIRLTLDGPIPVSQWTTIIANVEDGAGNAIDSQGQLGPGVDEPDRIDIGFLPADTDQSGLVGPFDLLRFRSIIRELFTPAQGDPVDFADTNRNEIIDPFDLLRFRKLIVGVIPSTQSWSGQTLPERP